MYLVRIKWEIRKFKNFIDKFMVISRFSLFYTLLWMPSQKTQNLFKYFLHKRKEKQRVYSYKNDARTCSKWLMICLTFYLFIILFRIIPLFISIWKIFAIIWTETSFKFYYKIWIFYGVYPRAIQYTLLMAYNHKVMRWQYWNVDGQIYCYLFKILIL